MELNLNELERRAKSAGGQEWTLTIDATGDAFLSAENSEYVAEVGAVGEDGIVSDYGKFIAAANPAVVLELVRRLREAENDAWRYRKLRDEDAWGEDVALGGGSAWEMLGELHGSNFDKFVDARFQPTKNED